MRAAFDKLSANERKEVVSRAQELFAEGCPRTRKLSRNSRRDKGTKRFSRTKTSTEIGWLARRRNMVRAATKLPRTHNLVGAGHVNVGVALPRTHDLVGAGHVGAAELPQGLGREQRKCLAKQHQQILQREEEAFQDNCLLDHEITDELRARVTERQQKDAANDRKRRTTAERNNAGWQ